MSINEKFNYVEFPSTDIAKTKLFFSTVFNWEFHDYGLEYTSFSSENLNGGFYLSDKTSRTETGSALVVFYSLNLLKTRAKIIAADGVINKPIFDFPGGARFHFTDTTGNEYAVWSDQGC